MLVSVINKVSGDIDSNIVLKSLIISCVCGRLMEEVPGVFHKKATASSLKIFTPKLDYKIMILMNSINTVGFLKSKST